MTTLTFPLGAGMGSLINMEAEEEEAEEDMTQEEEVEEEEMAQEEKVEEEEDL